MKGNGNIEYREKNIEVRRQSLISKWEGLYVFSGFLPTSTSYFNFLVQLPCSLFLAPYSFSIVPGFRKNDVSQKRRIGEHRDRELGEAAMDEGKKWIYPARQETSNILHSSLETWTNGWNIGVWFPSSRGFGSTTFQGNEWLKNTGIGNWRSNNGRGQNETRAKD